MSRGMVKSLRLTDLNDFIGGLPLGGGDARINPASESSRHHSRRTALAGSGKV